MNTPSVLRQASRIRSLAGSIISNINRSADIHEELKAVGGLSKDQSDHYLGKTEAVLDEILAAVGEAKKALTEEEPTDAHIPSDEA